MTKSKFFTTVALFILVLFIPLFVAGLMMIVLSDGVGMVLGGIAFWAVDAYFGVRLYHYIKDNKDEGEMCLDAYELQILKKI